MNNIHWRLFTSVHECWNGSQNDHTQTRRNLKKRAESLPQNLSENLSLIQSIITEIKPERESLEVSN